MPRDDPSWELRIREATDKPLTPKMLARVFSNIQDLVNLLGEEVTGSKVRRAGPGPAGVRDPLELRIRDVSAGSVVALMDLPPQQHKLIPGPTLARQTFDKMSQLFDLLVAPEVSLADVERVVSDPQRRQQVLRHVEEMTTPSGAYVVESRVGVRRHKIDRRVRERAQRLRLANPTPADIEVEGRVVEMAVNQRRAIVVDAVDREELLTVKYPQEAEDRVQAHLGEMVRLRLTRDRKKVYHVVQPDDILLLTAIPVARVQLAQGELVFDPPLAFEWEFDEGGYYVAWNEDISVLAAHKKMSGLSRELTRQIRELWELYVECSEDELSSDALELRRHLLRLAGEHA